MSSDEFNLTSAGVSDRLRAKFDVHRTPDTIRAWARTGRLPVLEVQNGQSVWRLYRPSDVDAIGATLAAEDTQHVA
jgi:hypothetical protein